MDQLSNLIPVVSFLAGLGGGVHCVGMCGGLVTASCNSSKSVVSYQVGRLLGYLSLGALAGLLGEGLRGTLAELQLQVITAILLGVMFIYWGVRVYLGKKAELPMPRFLSKVYQSLWSKFIHKREGHPRAFFTGLISILLPCGLLYGVIIGATALGSVKEGVLSIGFFWLGTLPAMLAAPVILQKVLKPLRQRVPKIYATGLILLGLITIYHRGNLMPKVDAADQGVKPAVHSCH